MDSVNTEVLCMSRMQKVNYQDYSIGLFKDGGVTISGEWIVSYSKSKNGCRHYYVYNTRTKEMVMNKKKPEDSSFATVPTPNLQPNTVIDLSNDGLRFEGNCMNNTPFGFICIMNEKNELVYRGVMVNDKKECFGAEFYPGLNKTKYCGCYWNNKRHGFGMLYDRKGELLYEGGFICDSFEFEKSGIINESFYNNHIIHSLLKELIIGEECGNDLESDLRFYGYQNLESIIVRKNSFTRIKSFTLSGIFVWKFDTATNEKEPERSQSVRVKVTGIVIDDCSTGST